MGFFYKYIFHPFISRVIGRKAFTNNPYLGFVIDADESDVIADELFSVSLAYQQGLYSLPLDNSKAMEYCLKAAHRGHAVAQNFAIQWLMRKPDDTSEDVMSWLHMAAEQGEKQALYNLAVSYHRGDIDGTVNVEKSNELFRKAAEFGYAPAYTRMAQIYYNGEGVDKNETIAKYWALMEYVLMDPNKREKSCLFYFLEKEDYAKDNRIDAVKISEDAAVAGERDALNGIARGYYARGEKEKAMALWQQSADHGHPIAVYHLAQELCKNKTNYTQAKKLFEESCKLKYDGAYHGLAVMYYEGLGVERDMAKAWHYLEKSLNMGNDESRFLLATMCLHNDLEGIIPDVYGRGMRYMELAAQQGYEPAINYMKKM